MVRKTKSRKLTARKVPERPKDYISGWVRLNGKGEIIASSPSSHSEYDKAVTENALIDLVKILARICVEEELQKATNFDSPLSEAPIALAHHASLLHDD